MRTLKRLPPKSSLGQLDPPKSTHRQDGVRTSRPDCAHSDTLTGRLFLVVGLLTRNKKAVSEQNRMVTCNTLTRAQTKLL